MLQNLMRVSNELILTSLIDQTKPVNRSYQLEGREGLSSYNPGPTEMGAFSQSPLLLRGPDNLKQILYVNLS